MIHESQQLDGGKDQTWNAQILVSATVDQPSQGTVLESLQLAKKHANGWFLVLWATPDREENRRIAFYSCR